MASQDHTRSRSSEETALLRSVLRRFPGGVLGGYYAHDDLQFVVKEARGAHLYDFSGHQYLDYLLGSGPMVLGHAHPAVIAAVEAQLSRGTTYIQLSEPAVALAEEVCRAMPCAEPVRYTSSGSEATFFALRVARAFRKRERLFATGNHVKTALAEAAKRAGFRAQVAGEAPVFEIYFTDRPITDYRATLTDDRALHAAFTRELLERGVVKAAQKIYVSLAHSEEDIQRTVQVFTAAFEAVAEQRP